MPLLPLSFTAGRAWQGAAFAPSQSAVTNTAVMLAACVSAYVPAANCRRMCPNLLQSLKAPAMCKRNSSLNGLPSVTVLRIKCARS